MVIWLARMSLTLDTGHSIWLFVEFSISLTCVNAALMRLVTIRLIHSISSINLASSGFWENRFALMTKTTYHTNEALYEAQAWHDSAQQNAVNANWIPLRDTTHTYHRTLTTIQHVWTQQSTKPAERGTEETTCITQTSLAKKKQDCFPSMPSYVVRGECFVLVCYDAQNSYV